MAKTNQKCLNYRRPVTEGMKSFQPVDKLFINQINIQQIYDTVSYWKPNAQTYADIKTKKCAKGRKRSLSHVGTQC